MEKDLMNKEVLCIIDTRHIQRFIFRSNSFMDTVGGNDIIKHILDDSIIYALKNIDTPLADDEYDLSSDPYAEIPYFNSDKILFQLVICAAGNALCIVRTGGLCRKIIRKVSRYFLENTYSLNLAAAVTEKTDDFGMDIFNLYRKLNSIKASAEIPDPIGALPVIVKEARTGEPAIAIDEKTGEYYSRSSLLRREEASKREYIIGPQEIRSTVSLEGNEYIAVMHMDGNNLGITIGKILQRWPGYEEGIRVRRRINKNIINIYSKVVNETLEQLRAYYARRYGDEGNFCNSFEIVHQGGDDLNVLCDAALAMPFTEMFYANLEGSILWKSETLNFPLYVCAGIAFVPKSTSFHAAYKLAEECCTSAKTEAKKENNLRNGLAGNWIDFQVCSDIGIGDLHAEREKKYVTNDKIRLMTRPYCFDAETEGQPINYSKLQKLSHIIKKNDFPKSCMSMLKQPYVIGREEFRNWISGMKRMGIDLVELLGKPLYTDDEGLVHSLWFDAAEISEIILSE